MSRDMARKMFDMRKMSEIFRSIPSLIKSKKSLEIVSDDALLEIIDRANARDLMALRQSSRSMRKLVDEMPYMPYMARMIWPSRIFLNERIRLYKNRARLNHNGTLLNSNKKVNRFMETPPIMNKNELVGFKIKNNGNVTYANPNATATTLVMTLFKAFAHGARTTYLDTSSFPTKQDDYNKLGTYIQNGALSTLQGLIIVNQPTNRTQKLDVTPFVQALSLGALPRLNQLSVTRFDVINSVGSSPIVQMLRLLGPRLSYLNLYMAGINDDTCQKMFKMNMPKVLFIELNDNIITDLAFNHLSNGNHPTNNFPNLFRMNLRNNKLTQLITVDMVKKFIAPNLIGMDI